MLNTLLIGLFSAAIILLPVVTVVGIMEALEDLAERRRTARRCEKYEEAVRYIRRRNTKEDARIRRIWEDEAEELEHT